MLKHVTGVPRPYYNTVCRPNVNMNEEVSRYPYILNDKDVCENPDYEAIRSFPSLHAAAVFYNFVYLSCYYESRWTLENFVLLKPMLQGALFLGAIFTSCSRITDYKHHLTDVIVGSVLGVVSAIFLMVSATDIFKSLSSIPKTKMKQNEKID
ncbi:phospholipid phosphatase-related protein type 1-like isoform X1 [Anneissia japonica]|uniref:phospholipid phosphatase-related protein type 1-like isoform X1 n=1 Tax=Anneissia japonica TaxID=1529436 RepID=UPI00142568B1|nr:phospholipid phosphatase-related protein type 1-like isoform X1 [Anneissia japonica]